MKLLEYIISLFDNIFRDNTEQINHMYGAVRMLDKNRGKINPALIKLYKKLSA